MLGFHFLVTPIPIAKSRAQNVQYPIPEYLQSNKKFKVKIIISFKLKFVCFTFSQHWEHSFEHLPETVIFIWIAFWTLFQPISCKKKKNKQNNLINMVYVKIKKNKTS